MAILRILFAWCIPTADFLHRSKKEMSWFDLWSKPDFCSEQKPMVLHYAYQQILTYAVKEIKQPTSLPLERMGLSIDRHNVAVFSLLFEVADTQQTALYQSSRQPDVQQPTESIGSRHFQKTLNVGPQVHCPLHRNLY